MISLEEEATKQADEQKPEPCERCGGATGYGCHFWEHELCDKCQDAWWESAPAQALRFQTATSDAEWRETGVKPKNRPTSDDWQREIDKWVAQTRNQVAA